MTHPNGDIHLLKTMLPSSLPIRVSINNSERSQAQYDIAASSLADKLYLRDKETGTTRVNGRTLRLLNLGSFLVHLFYCDAIADVKGNDFLGQLSQLHDDGKYNLYLYTIMREVARTATEQGQSILPNNNHVPSPDKKAQLLSLYKSRSERIRMILATLSEWNVFGKEKVIIFSQNPTEQELLNAILNAVGLRSKALLSRYSQDTKEDIISRFDTPMVPFDAARAETESEKDVEILVLSVNQSTGLNLQNNCSKIILTGPAPTHPVYLQCCGRIVRFGQKHGCVIIGFYDPNTHNARIVEGATRRALPAMGAWLDVQKFGATLCHTALYDTFYSHVAFWAFFQETALQSDHAKVLLAPARRFVRSVA